MKFKSVIRAAVFIIIISAILYIVNVSLKPKYYLSNSSWPTTSTYQAFYEMDRNSIDVLFLGSSLCVNEFSPMEIYNHYGIRSFNLGSEQQSVFLSYYWLKEALRFQKPSVVILEGRFLSTCIEDNAIHTPESLTRKCLDPMKWSSVKLEAIKDLCSLDKTQDIKSWLFTNIRFHDRWKSLDETDFTLDTDITCSQLMGWAPGNDGELNDFTPFTPSDEDKSFSLYPLMTEYCLKMSNLCKDYGIRFVIVNVPYDTDAKINFTINSFAKENEIDYIEMSEESVWKELEVLLPYENPIGHGNIWGNIKVSQYIGKLLSEKYDVPSVTDSQFESKKAFYEHINNRFRLMTATNIVEYLSFLLDDDYFYIFVAAQDTSEIRIPKKAKPLLKSLGFEYEWNKQTDYGISYLAVKNDEGVIEKTNGNIDLSGQFREKRDSYSMVSTGFEGVDEPYTSIIINGVDYSKNIYGLNFVVYDLAKRSVVDNVAFDSHANFKLFR